MTPRHPRELVIPCRVDGVPVRGPHDRTLTHVLLRGQHVQLTLKKNRWLANCVSTVHV